MKFNFYTVELYNTIFIIQFLYIIYIEHINTAKWYKNFLLLWSLSVFYTNLNFFLYIKVCTKEKRKSKISFPLKKGHFLAGSTWPHLYQSKSRVSWFASVNNIID